MKMANREQKNVEHDEENPVNWGKEEVDSWLQLQWPQLGNFLPIMVSKNTFQVRATLCLNCLAGNS